MATPRPFSYYPTEYGELFMKAVHSPISVPCASPAAAKRMRGQLYAFRTSLAVKNCGADPNLIIIAPLISFRIEGNTLIAYRPQRAITLAKALNHVRDNSTRPPEEGGIPASIRQHNADDT